MLASMEDFLEVLVLLSLVAVLFSWTTMLRMSPTLAARLSLTMDRELPSCQSESARSEMVNERTIAMRKVWSPGISRQTVGMRVLGGPPAKAGTPNVEGWLL